MSRIIRIDQHGALFLNGQLLPGQITALNIGGKMVIDHAMTEGASGKKKSFSGFDDALITIELTLIEVMDGGRSRYGHLKTLSGAFKAIESGAPIVYGVQGELFDAHSVRHVLFSSLSSNDVPDADALKVSLKFTEHDPMVSLVQEQQSGASTESAADSVAEPDAIPEGVSLAEHRKVMQIEALHG